MNEIRRLEDLWGGSFGDAYIERNSKASEGREPFWRKLINKYPVTSALEVGCNVGGNLHWISKIIGAEKTYGVDINPKAISEIRNRAEGVNASVASAKQLPFADGEFDLVFTAGVLIHQPEESLECVMNEIIRCSSKYVLAVEYFSEQVTEVPYRGNKGMLFKRNYGEIYSRLNPSLQLIDKGFLDEGSWDDCNYWLFKKSVSEK